MLRWLMRRLRCCRSVHKNLKQAPFSLLVLLPTHQIFNLTRVILPSAAITADNQALVFIDSVKLVITTGRHLKRI